MIKQARVTHLTVGFPRNDIMDLLHKSSLAYNFDFVELPRTWSGRLSVLDKMRIVGGYIASGAVPRDAVVLFTDGYDTLVTGSAADLAHRFLASNADLIFNGEIVFFPEDKPRPETRTWFERNSDPYRYLNSGCYIGYAWAVEAMTRWCISNAKRFDTEDDQFLAQEFLIHARDEGLRINPTLDSRADFFATLVGSADRFGYFAGSVVNLKTGLPVSVIHANGFKDNLASLRAVALLSAEHPPLDLRVLTTADGQLCAHKTSAGKLHLASASDPEAVFFLVAGNRYVVGLGSKQQCVSWQPDFTVKMHAQHINKWEMLHYREMTSDQGHYVQRYISEDAGALHLRPIPLELLKVIDVPKLVAFSRSVLQLI